MTESLRVTYGSHISELGNQRTDLVLLEADLADSRRIYPVMKPVASDLHVQYLPA